jgi:hypothetical protein
MATDNQKLIVKLLLENKEYLKGLQKSEKATGSFSSSVKKLGGVMAAVFSVSKIVSFTKASVKAYDIQIKAETKLLTALKGRTDLQKTLIDQAQQLQRTTLFGDEATIEAQAMLASLGLNADAIKKLTPLVQDLATKSNMGLVQAADMVAKSVGSSTNALSRYGIVIEGTVGTAERLNSAIASLNQQVGGQAAAAAKVGTGAIVQLGNAWGDLMESIGKWIADPAMIALINKLTALLQGDGGGGAVVKSNNGILTEGWLTGQSKEDLKKELAILE